MAALHLLEIPGVFLRRCALPGGDISINALRNLVSRAFTGRRADAMEPRIRGIARGLIDGFVHGKGCSYCSGTGYRDRIGVYELLRITPEIRRLIVGWATTEELRRLAVAQGMRTMLREAMQMVEDDVTTISEVVRTLFAH